MSFALKANLDRNAILLSIQEIQGRSTNIANWSYKAEGDLSSTWHVVTPLIYEFLLVAQHVLIELCC